MTPEIDSSGRPLQYPPAILWTFEDCKKDPSIDFTVANEARVALQKIIRHPNGTMVTHSAVKAITSRARPIVDKILARIPSHIQRKDIGKSYFRTTYPAEWDGACHELETAQPLLKLCSGHWKAEFVLAQVIQSIKRGKNLKGKAAASNSRSASPELDPTASDIYHTPISQQSPNGSTISKKRQRSDSDIQTPSVDMVPPASQPPTLDNRAASLPAKKSKKGNNVVEKRSSKASNKQKKPLCEYTCFLIHVRFLTPMLAFANITSGLGTGTHKNTPGPSSESLDSTPAMLEPTPAMLEPTPATLEPTPATLEPTPATLDPQPVPETSTVHLIHVMATCTFFFYTKIKVTADIPFR